MTSASAEETKTSWCPFGLRGVRGLKSTGWFLKSQQVFCPGVSHCETWYFLRVRKARVGIRVGKLKERQRKAEAKVAAESPETMPWSRDGRRAATT